MNVATGFKKPMIRVAPIGVEKPFIRCCPTAALLPTTD